MSKYIFNNDTDILEFLEQLRENGIQIWGEGEKIRYRSKNRQLAPETLRILKMAKGQILDFFRMIEKNVIPLTSIQTAYVVGQTAGCELGNINAHYYIEYTIESLDVERLEQMINLVISKNDALRLIVTHEGKASFLDNVPYYSVPVYSLYDGNDREQKRLERSHHRYNYYKWPMFHFCVGKTSGKTSVLHVDFDCIILDAWSAKLLLNEIFSLYYGKDVKFPRISFMNYMRLKTDKGDLEAEEYWKEKVKNMPSFPKLNYQKKFAEVQNVRFDRIECDFSFIETQRLYQKIKNYHFTPAAVISTIFMKTLAQYSETPGLSINVTLFNRQLLHEDVNKMLRLYALRAANYMWQRGVRRNDKIVVILPRGIGQVAALLGILAIGAAYVPIAMKQPLGRRKKIIENVKPALVLQDEAFLEENPWTGCIENNSKDTAYIIYTSGSSGEPKGVEMSHVAAMNTIEEILHMWNIGAEDSVLNISAFDFDLSVFDIFGLLTVGGTIVLIDEDDFRDPEVWKNLIEIYGITIWNSAPALLDMFLIMGENNHFGKLRLALVSGDWIPLYLPEKWYKVTSANSQFVALGGATEGGIWSNYYCVSKVDRLWNSIPYGQALPKQKYRITDENFVECGVDIPGELQIGGGSLAKGYINDEELTMKKFITDVKGERWYRTGDRGRRWADGTIEFLGRMDTQVKIRGHRIELGEIESVLKSISRIKEAVVVAQGDKYHKELVI